MEIFDLVHVDHFDRVVLLVLARFEHGANAPITSRKQEIIAIHADVTLTLGHMEFCGGV